MNKTCYIIAGPNGAGKTTFAMDLLPDEAQCKNYINADLITKGLSPFSPELVSVQAGKLMLGEIDKCVKAGASFAFETTLSGLAYRKKIADWHDAGTKLFCIIFLYQRLLWQLNE